MKTTCERCGLEVSTCGLKSHRGSYRCIQYRNIRDLERDGFRKLASYEKAGNNEKMVRAYTGRVQGGPGRRTKLTLQRWVRSES